jgi:sulfur-oxidizing protein SoxY
MILFADLNPIPKIIDMDLKAIYPLISLNIKVAQETPLRALILDENSVWHIGSNNIKSFGGGCSVASVTSSDTDFGKLLGKIKSEVFEVEKDTYRIKSSIFHPMETGLIFGNPEFYINKIVLKDGINILSTMELFSAISENPRFIFETKVKSQNYIIEFSDVDGNVFTSDIK